MNQRISNIVIVFFYLFLISCGDSANTSNPNVLILLADDLGSTDLACYGGKSHTPNLDNLAKEGLLFTNFYAPAPNCSPSRVGLLTGRIPSKAGMYNYRAPKQVMHLREYEITLPEYLKAKGYQTAHFGKWHLGCLPQDSILNHPQPLEHGFDYSLGTENNATPSHLNPTNFIRNGKAVGETNGYSCQLLAVEVQSWFDNNYQKEKPFFLYVAFHEVHSKIASPDEMIRNYPGESEKDAKYFANVENMDDASGKILNILKNQGLLKNTLVVFASDNGPYRKGSAGELRGLKGEVFDGGIRVPGIISWPAVIKKSKTIETPAGLIDVLPTLEDCCELMVSTQPRLDGTSLTPLFYGDTIKREIPLMWFYYRSFPEVSLRMDNYILIGNALDSVPRTHPISDLDMEFIRSIEIQKFELYDIIKDPGQSINIIHKKPQIAEEMIPHMKKLISDIKEVGPYWKGLYKYDNYPSKFKKKYIR